MKKKVGIITYHSAHNLGAVLQSYALKESIKKNNRNVEMINYEPYGLLADYQLFMNYSFLREVKKESYYKITRYYIGRLKNYSQANKKIKKYKEFLKSEFENSPGIYTNQNELSNNSFDYDYYVAGSDQIWNPQFHDKIGGLEPYFLNFVKNRGRKISYAASIASNPTIEEFSKYKDHLKDFDNISVRERTHKDLVENISNKKIEVVLDPTFLLKREEYKKITSEVQNGEKYILVYDLTFDQNTIDLANRISELTGYKVISFSKGKGYRSFLKSYGYEGPREFLNLIENAKFVIANSFHGTAFSIIYNKPFYTVPHPTRGSRMVDLLTKLSLEERIVYKNKDLKDINLTLDYTKPNKLLEKERNNSLNYLLKALEVNNEK